jgi:hypothetical protein
MKYIHERANREKINKLPSTQTGSNDRKGPDLTLFKVNGR